RRLLPIRRFSQRVVGGAGGAAPRWQDDPGFDLDRHVLAATLPPPGDDAALAAEIGALMGEPLAADRPLWEMRLYHGYLDGSALLVRIHHAIGDGVALMLVLLGLTDVEPGGGDAAPADPTGVEPAGANPFTDLFCHPEVDLDAIRALADELSP